jgi:hypothetical protein
MTLDVAKNISFNTDANIVTVSVDSTTSSTLIAAQDINNDGKRIKVLVCNDGNKLLWVKLQPASTDNDKKGISVLPGTSMKLIGDDDIYTGEISAIFEVGGARNVHVTWY